MTCGTVYATVDEYLTFWCEESADDDTRTIIAAMLKFASATVDVNRQASNQCGTLGAGMDNYVKLLTMIVAAVIHNCPCGRVLNDPQLKQMWLEWANGELANIRSGKLAVQQGQTGAEYPSLGFAEHSWTAPNAIKIVRNRIYRTGI